MRRRRDLGGRNTRFDHAVGHDACVTAEETAREEEPPMPLLQPILRPPSAVQPFAALGSSLQGAFDRDLHDFCRNAMMRWHAAPATLPDLGPQRSLAAQQATEAKTDRFLERLEGTLRRGARRPKQRQRTERRLEHLIRDFARDARLMPAEQLDRIGSEALFAVTEDFLRQAHAFDAQLTPEDRFQALRNVWIMNLLQQILGQPVSLTPAMVGYSLLYPFTDNWLDDPAISEGAKRAFCSRLARRLAGECLAASSEHEQAVFALVAKIEQVFPRARFPGVYHSLLAIHRGQMASLRLQGREAVPQRRILETSLAKGGASVLADGYLVAGTLDRATADFCFGYGAALQLIDDLQDLDDDRRAGHRTIFSDPGDAGAQDPLVMKLIHFLDSVLERPRHRASRTRTVLLDLVRDNCVQMILFAAGNHAERFRPSFVATLESRAVMRFAYAQRCTKTVRERAERLGETLRHSPLAELVVARHR